MRRITTFRSTTDRIHEGGPIILQYILYIKYIIHIIYYNIMVYYYNTTVLQLPTVFTTVTVQFCSLGAIDYTI